MVRVRSPTEIHKKINLRLKERFGLESELCESRNPYHVNLPLVVKCGMKKKWSEIICRIMLHNINTIYISYN